MKLKHNAVDLFAIREKGDALYINSLAVAPKFRRFGIATYILGYTERTARKRGKHRLELSVLRLSIATQRVYRRFGFVKKEEKNWSYTLKKDLKHVCHTNVLIYRFCGQILNTLLIGQN